MTDSPVDPTDESPASESAIPEHSESDTGPVGPGSPVSSLVPSLAVAGLFVVVDQITKRWAVNRLFGGRTIDLVGSLRFNLVYNQGMAFSRFRGVGQYIGVLALVVVCFLALSLRRADSRLSSIATGMIIGGAIGNVLDRLFRGGGWLKGGVIDFIDLQWWPIFNVADIGVTVGGTLLVLSSVLRNRSPARWLSTSAALSFSGSP